MGQLQKKQCLDTVCASIAKQHMRTVSAGYHGSYASRLVRPHCSQHAQIARGAVLQDNPDTVTMEQHSKIPHPFLPSPCSFIYSPLGSHVPNMISAGTF